MRKLLLERSPSGPGEPAGSLAERRAAEREAKLAAALRTNLRRRKAQARARRDVVEDARAVSSGEAPPTATDDGGGT